jgi:hypothetical protein
MLWEAEPLEATRKKLEARGITGLVFEVVNNQPAGGDFLSAMRANLETLDREKRRAVPSPQ